jgi:hypothetical protein
VCNKQNRLVPVRDDAAYRISEYEMPYYVSCLLDITPAARCLKIPCSRMHSELQARNHDGDSLFVQVRTTGINTAFISPSIEHRAMFPPEPPKNL